MAHLEETGDGAATGRLETAGSGAVPVLRLSGEIDLSNAHTLRDALDRILESRPSRMIFDLTELAFMDSSGLALLLHVTEHGVEVELRSPSPIVRRIVEATGLSTVLRIAP